MKITRKTGIWMIVIGIVFQFLNIVTYSQWNIDIDIVGAIILIIGLVVMITKWRVK